MVLKRGKGKKEHAPKGEIVIVLALNTGKKPERPKKKGKKKGKKKA